MKSISRPWTIISIPQVLFTSFNCDLFFYSLTLALTFPNDRKLKLTHQNNWFLFNFFFDELQFINNSIYHGNSLKKKLLFLNYCFLHSKKNPNFMLNNEFNYHQWIYSLNCNEPQTKPAWFTQADEILQYYVNAIAHKLV
jgi:hypothetical protein